MKIFKILKFFLHKYLKKLNFPQKYATIEILTYSKKEGIHKMEMSEIIKQHRIALDMSQEELGKRLNPPVNKAAVQKWEKGIFLCGPPEAETVDHGYRKGAYGKTGGVQWRSGNCAAINEHTFGSKARRRTRIFLNNKKPLYGVNAMQGFSG